MNSTFAHDRTLVHQLVSRFRPFQHVLLRPFASIVHCLQFGDTRWMDLPEDGIILSGRFKGISNAHPATDF